MSPCVSDVNVDVIYVSPVNVSDEMSQFYDRLLGLCPAVESGDVTDQADLSSRYRIITPEAVNLFHVSAVDLFYYVDLCSSLFLGIFVTRHEFS